jgi:hypothetical protein
VGDGYAAMIVGNGMMIEARYQYRVQNNDRRHVVASGPEIAEDLRRSSSCRGCSGAGRRHAHPTMRDLAQREHIDTRGYFTLDPDKVK